jgi:hypothetical protein
MPDFNDATGQWYRGILTALDGLMADAHANLPEPVSKPVEAHLLGRALRGQPIGRGGLCDLLAVLMVDTMRTTTRRTE